MARDGGTPDLGMMMLRYDDDGGGALSLCLPPLISRRRKDGSDAIRSAFLLLSSLEIYDFCSSQICHSVQMGKLACMIGDASIDGW